MRNKLILFLIAAAALTVPAVSAAESADTVFGKVDTVEIEADGGGQAAGVKKQDAFVPGEDRMSLRIGGRWDLTMRGLMFGFVNAPGMPGGADVAMGKSFEISWLQLLAVRYTSASRNTQISFGAGIDWRNYKLQGAETRFMADGHGHVTAGPYPDDVDAHFSRLKVFSIGFPLLVEQKLPFMVPGGAKFSITAGVVFNYNVHGSMLTEWADQEGNRVEQSCNTIGQRQFTVDLLGMVRFCKFAGLYVKYSPQTVLHGSVNPRFHSFSTGIICFY